MGELKTTIPATRFYDDGLAFAVAHIAGVHDGLGGNRIVQPYTGPIRNVHPEGTRIPHLNDLDLAIVVLKTEQPC